jgi:hypothetical protein
MTASRGLHLAFSDLLQLPTVSRDWCTLFWIFLLRENCFLDGVLGSWGVHSVHRSWEQDSQDSKEYDVLSDFKASYQSPIFRSPVVVEVFVYTDSVGFGQPGCTAGALLAFE